MRKEWTMPERRRAVALREEGYSYTGVALLLGTNRSADAVAAHLRALRLENARSH